jgi:hypothetical protein
MRFPEHIRSIVDGGSQMAKKPKEEDFVEETRRFWSETAVRELSSEDAREIIQNTNYFLDVLISIAQRMERDGVAPFDKASVRPLTSGVSAEPLPEQCNRPRELPQEAGEPLHDSEGEKSQGDPKYAPECSSR